MAIKATILNPIDMYQYGALELNCGHMELAQDDADDPISYRGPGYIRQDDAGHIAFKLFATEARKHPSPAEFAQVGTAGKLLAPDRYYTLTACDALGRRWVAEKIIPHSDHGAGGQLISVGGRLHSITSVGEVEYAAFSHNIYFFEEFEYFIMNKMRLYKFVEQRAELFHIAKGFEDKAFQSADFAVSIQKGDGVVTVGLDAIKPFPAHIDIRVVEALQFMLARSLWCRAMTSIIGNQETIRLISPRPASARTRLPPPISLWSVAGHQHLWQLFDLYLRYILRKGEPGWHTCSVHLHAACEASANSIEAYALGLAVAVEGITKALYPEHAKRDRNYHELAKEIFRYFDLLFGRIGRCVADHDDDVANLRKRIAGFQGQLLGVSAEDRMRQLAREGVVDEGHISAWKKLRNTSAHAGAPGAPVDQRLLDRINSTAVMMYHMIFNTIGYKGLYTDYSTHGYPTRAYPSREIAPDKQ